MNKRILHCVYFRSPEGGLHEHVFLNAKVAMQEGLYSIVACPSGSFADRVEAAGVEVFRTDFESRDAFFEHFSREDKLPGLIHVHPGASRKMGVALGQKYKIKTIITIHGRWLNALQGYTDNLSFIICVSNAVYRHVTQHLVESNCENEINKAIMIPNAVSPPQFVPDNESSKKTIFCSSRFDEDKRPLIKFILDCFGQDNTEIDWVFAGDGKCLDEIKSAAVENDVHAKFLGWVDQECLYHNLSQSHFVIAPGRAAMESLWCNKPTVCVGSGGVTPALNEIEAIRALNSNFGGIGSGNQISASEFYERIRAWRFEKLEMEGVMNNFCSYEDSNNKLAFLYRMLTKEQRS